MIKAITYILLLLIYSAQTFSQQELNTKDYLPLIKDGYIKLFQKIRLTDSDTTIYVYNEYQYLEENNRKYLIAKSYDEDTTLNSIFTEEVTDKGLRFVKGLIIEKGHSDSSVVLVKGRNKITYPFKPVSQMGGWRTKTKQHYSNRINVHSEIEYLGNGSVNINDTTLTVLNFKREVKAKYKKEYKKKKVNYEFLWSFGIGNGLIIYSKKGKDSFTATIVESKYIN